jgi:hypothetical protein
MLRFALSLEDSIMHSTALRSRHRRPCARAALAVAVLAAASPQARADVYLDPMGGSGGGAFQAHCPTGQLLAGFELRAADDVDAIRPLCVSARGPRETSAASPSSWHGGNGGSSSYLICPRSTPIVTGMRVIAQGEETIVVNNIHLNCGLAADTQTVSNSVAASFDAPPHRSGGLFARFALETDESQHCPAGQVAVGMNGRSGRWLDAMGLICGRPQMAKSLGRVPMSAPAQPHAAGWTICDSARDARARNSPAAPNLEAQCARLPAKTLGRVSGSAPPAPHPAGWTICDSARDAKARNSPAAPNLARQCEAIAPRPNWCEAAQAARDRGAPDERLDSRCRATGGTP